MDFPFGEIDSRGTNPLVIFYFALMDNFIGRTINKLNLIIFIKIPQDLNKCTIDEAVATFILADDSFKVEHRLAALFL